jgi:toxin ParE1/3/4
VAELAFDPVFYADLARITAHLAAKESQDIDARLAEVFEALGLLKRHPLIGRPAGSPKRELVIGRGSRGYIARYRYDDRLDSVIVLALRAQRESGFPEP